MTKLPVKKKLPKSPVSNYKAKHTAPSHELATPKPKRTKTPSPKVIASEAIRRAINGLEELSADAFTMMCGSTVSEAKRDKVLASAKKISNKLMERCTNTVNRHYA